VRAEPGDEQEAGGEGAGDAAYRARGIDAATVLPVRARLRTASLTTTGEMPLAPCWAAGRALPSEQNTQNYVPVARYAPPAVHRQDEEAGQPAKKKTPPALAVRPSGRPACAEEVARLMPASTTPMTLVPV